MADNGVYDPFGDAFTFDYPILGGWWFGALDPGAGIYYDPGPPDLPPEPQLPPEVQLGEPPAAPNPQLGVEELPPVNTTGPAPLPNPYGNYADDLPAYDYTGTPIPQAPPSEQYNDIIGLGLPVEAPRMPLPAQTQERPAYVPRLQPIRRARSPRRRTVAESATGIAASALGTALPLPVRRPRQSPSSSRVGSSSLPFNRIPRDPLDELGGQAGVGSLPKRRVLPRIPRRPRRTRPAPDRTPRRPRPRRFVPAPVFPLPRREWEPFPRLPPQPIRTLPSDPPRRIDVPRPPSVTPAPAPFPLPSPATPAIFPQIPAPSVPAPIPSIPAPGGPAQSPTRRVQPGPATPLWPFPRFIPRRRRTQPAPAPELEPIPRGEPLPLPEPLRTLGDAPQPLTRLNEQPVPFPEPLPQLQPQTESCRQCEDERKRRRRPSNVIASVKAFGRRMSRNSLDNLR